MIVRIMRTTKPLDALIGATRQRVLAETYRNPERWWYLHELARTLKLRPSSIQRDLTVLAAGGLLARRQNGNRVYFKADDTSPIFPELRQLLLKTIGLADVLKEALQALAAKVQVAFVYGSVASSEERSSRDVDLMIVGQVRLAEVAAALRGVASRIGRSVNPTVYAPREFATKLKQGNHFLKNVVAGRKLFICGSEDDLGRALDQRARQATYHQRSGNSEPS
jgi:DNA-binding transcriptional ArsR family regulator